ncbi:MAG: hypothetical protein CMB79_18190 [Filomicrobium sp.]|nr:hypothetical protein [Filomicrobium sp.]
MLNAAAIYESVCLYNLVYDLLQRCGLNWQAITLPYAHAIAGDELASVMSRPASFKTMGAIGRLWLMVVIGAWLAGPSFGKAPGKRHCYRGVCVKVLTVSQVQGLLGKTVRMTASHYGDPSVDPFNRGTFTSNGERFNANDPTRTASATLPDGTELLLRNPDTGAVSHVRVNDFGPFWVN